MTKTSTATVMPFPCMHIDTDNPENGVTEMNMCCENGVMDILPHMTKNLAVFEGAAFLFHQLDGIANVLADKKVSEMEKVPAVKTVWMSAQIQQARYLMDKVFDFAVVNKGLYQTYNNAFRVNQPDDFDAIEFLASVADRLEDIFIATGMTEREAENPDFDTIMESTRYATMCGTARTAILAMRSIG